MKFIAPIVTIAISASCMIATSSVHAVNSNRVLRNVLRGNVDRDLRIRNLEPSGEGEEESESLSDSLSDSLSESEDESESLDSIEEESTGGDSLVQVDSGEATGDGTVQELKLLDLESGASGISGIEVSNGEDQEEDGAESVSEDESLSDSLSDSLSESEDESESLDSIEEEATEDSLVQVDAGEATTRDSSAQMNLLDLESGASSISGIGVTNEVEEEDGAESVSEDESLSDSLSDSLSESEDESLDSTEEEVTGDSLVQVDAGETATRDSSAQMNLLDLQSEIDELQSEISNLESEITSTSGIVGTDEVGVESESEDEEESESLSESEDESVSLDITDEEGNADGTLVRVIAGKVSRPSSARVNLLRFDSVSTNMTTNTSGIGAESESEDEVESESLSESEDESQSSDEEGNADGMVQVDGVDLVQMNLLDYQSGATNMLDTGIASTFLGILMTGLFHLI